MNPPASVVVADVTNVPSLSRSSTVACATRRKSAFCTYPVIV